MGVPTELKYEKDQHVWIFVNGNVATIGVTDFAQSQFGELLFVELPDVDDEFLRGDEFSVVESSKRVSPLEAPFSFKVIEVNEVLNDEPKRINQDAYGNWMVKVEITDIDGMNDLVSAKDNDASIAQ
jgi:glycine cleavage system H protein